MKEIIIFNYQHYCLPYSILTAKLRAFFLYNNIKYDYKEGDKKIFYDIDSYVISKNYDFVFINGCIARIANKKYFKKAIEKFIKSNHNLKVILFGCGGGFKLDLELTNNKNIFQIPIGKEYLIDKFFKKINLSFINISSLLLNNFISFGSWRFLTDKDKNRFFILVSRGCKNNCSYCTIKKVIGNVKSKSIENIISEIKKGYESSKFDELVLVSDDLGSYGLDIGIDFTVLLKEIVKLNLDISINIDYIEPSSIISKFYLIESIVCRISYLCIPVQSFNNRILKLMNRRYNVEDYIKTIKLIKEINPNIIITNQIIFGYPTESFIEFKNNFKYIDYFNKTDFYIYSHISDIDKKMYKEEDLVKEEKLDLRLRILEKYDLKHIGKIYFDKLKH